MKQRQAKKEGCQCPKCQSLCQHEPGWFLPEEIVDAASFFDISREDFLSKYCESHQKEGVICYSPLFLRREKRCLFFKNEACQIHEVKPYECRKVYGCESPRRHKRIRELIERRYEK